MDADFDESPEEQQLIVLLNQDMSLFFEVPAFYSLSFGFCISSLCRKRLCSCQALFTDLHTLENVLTDTKNLKKVHQTLVEQNQKLIMMTRSMEQVLSNVSSVKTQKPGQ